MCAELFTLPQHLLRHVTRNDVAWDRNTAESDSSCTTVTPTPWISTYLTDGRRVSNHPGSCVNSHRSECSTDQRKYRPRGRFRSGTVRWERVQVTPRGDRRRGTAIWNSTFTDLLYTQENIIQNICCKLFSIWSAGFLRHQGETQAELRHGTGHQVFLKAQRLTTCRGARHKSAAAVIIRNLIYIISFSPIAQIHCNDITNH